RLPPRLPAAARTYAYSLSLHDALPISERMGIENELDAYISGFHLDALSSGLPLNVDLDTTLTVIAGNLYRLLARQLPRYEHATRSEEHTSELQSPDHLVCRLLLEKKKH